MMRASFYGRLIGIGAIVVLACSTLAHCLTRPIEPNEHMYLAAASLAMEYNLYGDFAYLQMPYLPWLYAKVFMLAGTEYLLLTARLCTWLSILIAGASIAWIARAYTPCRWTQLASVSALICCESFVIVSGECSNYIHALSLSLGGYACWIVWRNRRGAFLCGTAMGVAIGLKLYYAVLIPVLFVALWIYDRKQPTTRRYAWFMAGAALALLPAAWSAIRYPEAFLFNNWSFHHLTASWYRGLDYPDRVSLWSKLRYGKSWLQHPSQIWILFGGVLILVDWIRRRLRLTLPTDVGCGAAIVMAGWAAAFSPTPAWPQYFVLPVPFAICVILAAGARRRAALRAGIVCAAIVGVIVTGPYYARCITRAVRSENWIPIASHDHAQRAFHSATSIERPKVATLLPLLALEGGGTIYRELAAANFLLQVSHLIDPLKLQHFCGIAPQELPRLLQQQPPDLIVTSMQRAPPGGSPALEELFDQFAERHSYVRYDHPTLGVYIWSKNDAP